MLKADFVRRYALLADDTEHAKAQASSAGPGAGAGALPSSELLCTDHGIAGEWQIGLSKTFMRDGMYSHLEGRRAVVLDRRVRCMQASDRPFVTLEGREGNPLSLEGHPL